MSAIRKLYIDIEKIKRQINFLYCKLNNVKTTVIVPDPTPVEPSGWSLTGNAGTDPDINFIGTLDYKAFAVRINDTKMVIFDPNGVDFNAMTLTPGGGSSTTSINFKVFNTNNIIWRLVSKYNGNSMLANQEFHYNTGSNYTKVGQISVFDDSYFNTMYGNFGIGTMTPTQKLDVDGAARFRVYGSGTKVGVPTYNIAVDANGNLIETVLETISILDDPRTQFIELGDIEASDIVTAFNAHTFIGTENPVQSQNNGYVVVNAIQNGISVQYLFLGQGGVYGTGVKIATIQDFIVFIDQSLAVGTQYIDVGEIGLSLIEDVFNTQSPCVPVQSHTIGYVIIDATINGQAVQYLFVGDTGDYGVGCIDNATNELFVNLTDVPVPFTYDDVFHEADGSGQSNGVRATRYSIPIVHGGNISAPMFITSGGASGGIRNKGTNHLYISGNQGIKFRTGNSNHGLFDFSQGGISSYDADRTRWNAKFSRLYNDKIIENYSGGNHKRTFTGVEISDTVNLFGKSSDSEYIALHIKSTFASGETRRMYAIKTERGGVNLSGLPIASTGLFSGDLWNDGGTIKIV